ncbi:hypothetical protein ACNKHW_17010 [Shigella flexneri]
MTKIRPPERRLAASCLRPQRNVMQMGGGTANKPECPADWFDRMVNKHGLDRQQLRKFYFQAKRLDSVLRLMGKQAPTASVKPQSVRTAHGCVIAKNLLRRTTCRTVWFVESV